MATDITKNYKSAVNNVITKASEAYSLISKGSMYLRITYPSKQVYVYAKIVSPMTSGSVLYDISVTGKCVELDFDDNHNIEGGNIATAMNITGLLAGTTTAPEDDPTVEIVDEKDFNGAADMLADFIKNVK